MGATYRIGMNLFETSNDQWHNLLSFKGKLKRSIVFIGICLGPLFGRQFVQPFTVTFRVGYLLKFASYTPKKITKTLIMYQEIMNTLLLQGKTFAWVS